MKFISTSGNGPSVSFREAVLQNLPSDGGLYFPSEIPHLDQGFLSEIPELSLAEVASHALAAFCREDVPGEILTQICERVFHFDIPITKVEDGIHCLELFHGPTFAFKDVGAKFLAECLAYFSSGGNTERTVLVATSGDTGGAVANGFFGVEGVRVVILYPKGKVSSLQEKQLTTLGKNITALEVDGTFDDCQNLVKRAFADQETNNLLQLSSANSINIARWLPQSIYYYTPLQSGLQDPVISVPSGNYGNLTAGVLAKKMGIPIHSFIAASNANDVVPRYLMTSSYDPTETIATIANAMDVADPSNFKRLLAQFDGRYEEITEMLAPYSLDDTEIRQVINQCNSVNGYLLDPHSAIAYQALKERSELAREGILLGTAHYCKFLPTMEEALGHSLSVPDFASDLLERNKDAIDMKADFDSFKSFLLSL